MQAPTQSLAEEFLEMEKRTAQVRMNSKSSERPSLDILKQVRKERVDLKRSTRRVTTRHSEQSDKSPRVI